jgi:hypothetical protein
MRTLLVIGAVIIAPVIATMASPVWADEQRNFQLRLPEPWPSTQPNYLGNYQLKRPAYPYELNLPPPHYPEPWLPSPNIPTPPTHKNAYDDLMKQIEALKKHFGSMNDPLPPAHSPPFPGPRGLLWKKEFPQ